MQRFGLVASPDFLRHDTGGHVERKERLQALDPLWPTLPEWKAQPLREASDAELLLCHSPAVLERLARLCARGGGNLDADTVVSAASDGVARLAVGSSLDMLQAVVAGELTRGFVAARPPGHHATPGRSMGFCLYSTAAILARFAVQRLGLERVLRLDWDVHHGNGSQDCLLDTPQVRFVSLHQWPLYPGTGWWDERGCGNLFNVPLPAGSGDADFAYVLQRLIEPQLLDWEPQLILVSAGFDAHSRDPLGSMKLSADGFAAMAARLAGWAERCCGGRLLAVLEGGYDLLGLRDSVAATLRAWERPVAPERATEQRIAPAVLQRCADIESGWRA